MLCTKLPVAALEARRSITSITIVQHCRHRRLSQLTRVQLNANQLQQTTVVASRPRPRPRKSCTETVSVAGFDNNLNSGSAAAAAAADMVGSAAGDATYHESSFGSSSADAPRRRRKPAGSSRTAPALPEYATLANKTRKRVDYAPGTRVGEKVAVLLARQLRDLMKNPIPGISVAPDEDDMMIWHVTLAGPPGSPYAGGMFQVELTFPQDFPGHQPSIRFKTPIWHPNVSLPYGGTCVAFGETNRHVPDWLLFPSGPGTGEHGSQPMGHYNVRSVSCCLIGLQMLMSTPNPLSPLNIRAADQMRKDKAVFVEKAKRWTEKYGGKSFSELEALLKNGGNKLSLEDWRDLIGQPIVNHRPPQ